MVTIATYSTVQSKMSLPNFLIEFWKSARKSSLMEQVTKNYQQITESAAWFIWNYGNEENDDEKKCCQGKMTFSWSNELIVASCFPFVGIMMVKTKVRSSFFCMRHRICVFLPQFLRNWVIHPLALVHYRFQYFFLLQKLILKRQGDKKRRYTFDIKKIFFQSFSPILTDFKLILITSIFQLCIYHITPSCFLFQPIRTD